MIFLLTISSLCRNLSTYPASFIPYLVYHTLASVRYHLKPADDTHARADSGNAARALSFQLKSILAGRQRIAADDDANSKYLKESVFYRQTLGN